MIDKTNRLSQIEIIREKNMHRYPLLCLFSILFVIGIDGKVEISYFKETDPSKPDDRSSISATGVKSVEIFD